MSGYWIDLSGIIGLQKTLLTDISRDPATGDDVAVSDVNAALGGIAGNLRAADSAIGPTLTYQQEVNDILQRENRRLTTRKDAIDKAYEGQKRMVSLTDSITAKNQAYNYILFILVLVLLAFVGIKFLYSFEVIPSTLLDILNIAVLSIGFIYCIYLYIDIQRRYNMDFNQITLAEPTKKTPEQIQKDMENNIKSGNLLGLAKNTNTASGCTGSACCPTGTTFNEKYNVCVPNVVPFGTSGVTDNNKNDWKYFATKDATTGDVTYTWKDAAAASGCGSVANYDATILGCKPTTTTSGFTTLSISSADAKPFSATEFTDYSKV